MKYVLSVALMGWACLAGADLIIGSPETAPSSVGPNGAVREDWGVAELRLETPDGAHVAAQDYAVSPVPTVVTQIGAGSVNLTQTAYRAPIWPSGVDVVSATVANAGSDEADIRLVVAVPNEMGMGEYVGVLGGRPVLALPRNAQPIRRMKQWGCTGGVVAMPGWAKPEGECDPAFRNISAGMGGVPIEYRFAVPNGQKRSVVLGFCESFHSQPGQRPLVVRVEGAPKQEIDPLATWGRHIPGCVVFDAVDENNDGYLTVCVEPHPTGADKNPILNVIWVFKPETKVDLDAVKRGEKSAEAEYYVSVGGEKDQTLYENGPFAYEWKLAAGQSQTLTFLLGAAGGAVASPKDSPWTPDTLAKAAKDVWTDWFAQGKNLLEPAAEATRKDLARIVLSRVQAAGYFLALPEPAKLDQFSCAQAFQMIAALEDAGINAEAARLLRVFWDKPVAAPFAAFGQQEDGHWQDAVQDPAASAFALQALTRHAKIAGNTWTGPAWPAIQIGAEFLKKPEAQAALTTPEAKPAAESALKDVAEIETSRSASE